MDIKTIFRPLIKWWWLLATAGMLAAVSSFLITRGQPPVYEARTTLVVGSAVYQANPTGTDFYMIQQLAGFYADIASREPIRQATRQNLNLEWLPEYSVRALANSQLIEIVVRDSVPLRAQSVANELANQLILQSPGNTPQDGQSHGTFIEQQIAYLESKIEETIDDIDKAEAALGELVGAREIAEAQNEINALQNKLNTLQANYASLLQSSGQQASNSLTIIEPASLPAFPIGPNTGTIVLLSMAVALVIAAAAVYLLEYLDDTLKDPEEINRLLNMPVLGFFTEMHSEREVAYVVEEPRSLISEAFRSLRTNLEFVAVDSPLKMLGVTSANAREGKTFMALNLAMVMAQGGKRVILVDADFRRPSVHRFLGIPNREGLSDLFRPGVKLASVMTPCQQENLAVITAGSTPPNPTDLLGSKRMDEILGRLREMADIVIIDSPPFLIADAAILASKVDGVLWVVRHSFTRREDARTILQQFKRIGANVIGIAMNRIPKRSEEYYSHYYYYTEGEKPKALETNNSRIQVIKSVMMAWFSKFRRTTPNVEKRV